MFKVLKCYQSASQCILKFCCGQKPALLAFSGGPGVHDAARRAGAPGRDADGVRPLALPRGEPDAGRHRPRAVRKLRTRRAQAEVWRVASRRSVSSTDA